MAETTKERIADLRQKGLTVREIAGLLKVSTQNVYKHLKALEAEKQDDLAEVAS